MKVTASKTFVPFNEGASGIILLAVKPVLYSGDRRERLTFMVRPAEKFMVAEERGPDTFAHNAAMSQPSFIIRIAEGKETEVPFEIELPDDFPAQELTLRFLFADAWHEGGGRYAHSEEWSETYQKVQTMAQVEGKAISVEEAIHDLGKWTEMELKHVGERDTLKWHHGEDPVEFRRKLDETKALHGQLAYRMRTDQQVRQAYTYVQKMLGYSVSVYNDAQKGIVRQQMLDYLSKIRKKPLLQRIAWLQEVAKQEQAKYSKTG